MESGNDPLPRLFNLSEDISEKNNLADSFPEIKVQLAEILEKVKRK